LHQLLGNAALLRDGSRREDAVFLDMRTICGIYGFCGEFAN